MWRAKKDSIKRLSSKEGWGNCRVENKLERSELATQERRDILADIQLENLGRGLTREWGKGRNV